MDVEWCEMWTMLCFEMWWGEMVVGGRLQCNILCRIWWSEARCVATLNVCEMWRGTCGM